MSSECRSENQQDVKAGSGGFLSSSSHEKMCMNATRRLHFNFKNQLLRARRDLFARTTRFMAQPEHVRKAVNKRTAQFDSGKTKNSATTPNSTVADDVVESSSSSVTDGQTSGERGCLPCKKEFQDDNKEEGDNENTVDGPSFHDLIASFTSDIDAFAETVDDLENISESVQCLMRNLVNGDGRPVGAWKDLC